MLAWYVGARPDARLLLQQLQLHHSPCVVHAASLRACAQGVVDQRLAEGPDNWRLVYKTLLLMEYMLKHGPLVRG